MMLSVGALIDQAEQCLQEEEHDQAEELLQKADQKIHAFMFADDRNYEYLAMDQFMYSALVNLTRELTGTISEL